MMFGRCLVIGVKEKYACVNVKDCGNETDYLEIWEIMLNFAVKYRALDCMMQSKIIVIYVTDSNDSPLGSGRKDEF